MKRAPALIVVAGLFMASALFRGLESAATALDATPLNGSESQCLEKTTPASLTRALSEREGALSVREANLAEQESLIAAAKKDLEQQLVSLEEAQSELRAALAIAETGAEDDLAHLTSMYEAMDPEKSGPLFGQMSPKFAAEFLARMTPTAAAQVMTYLEPDHAYAVSAYIAGRNSQSAD